MRDVRGQWLRGTFIHAPDPDAFEVLEDALVKVGDDGRIASILPAGDPARAAIEAKSDVLRFGRDSMAEIEARTDLHDIAANHAARVAVPLLVCHGTADPAVPDSEGRALAEAAPNARFVVFDGADHVLGCRHPWQGPTPDFERFVALSARHFSDNL